MEELKELAYLLNKYQPRSIEIIGDESRSYDSKLYQLYDFIQKDKVHSDQEAAFLIYGEKKVSAKYRNLKHELKKRLFNTIFFIDTNSTKERDNAYYQSWKEWAACRILIEKSARKTAISLAQKIIKRAIAFDFFDLIVSISIFLRTHYAIREKDIEKFEYYDQLYERYKREEELKNLAHKYYMRLILDHTISSVTFNEQIAADAEKYFLKLSPLKKETQNPKFHYYMYQIRLLGTMGVFDYQEAKQICIEAINVLQSAKTELKSGVRNFLLNKLVCHIQLKEFEEGKKTALECQGLVTEGAFNWFKTNEYFFMLSMHTGNYQDAYDTYRTITAYPRFKTYKVIHETWSLNRIYLHFLYLLNQITPDQNDKSFNNVRLGKFINDMPSFSKDKNGMNIPVLIAQMAFLILQKKYDAAEERIDALNKYCDRYIKSNSPNFRSNCFIKMLLQIPISGFHKAGVERRAQRYFEKMQTMEINFNNQAHELEIIPFEKMWEFILVSLQNRFHSRPNRKASFSLRKNM